MMLLISTRSSAPHCILCLKQTPALTMTENIFLSETIGISFFKRAKSSQVTDEIMTSSELDLAETLYV